MTKYFLVLLVGWPASADAAATIPAVSAARGEKVFQAQGCNSCHSIRGVGGTTAPDLGKAVDRQFTPGLLAATMWNHAPVMWSAMRAAGTPIPRLSEQDAADLFAFFYATRLFERAGDAGRGKRVLTEKHCLKCHGQPAPGPDGARPLTEWQSRGNPIALVEAMWNHSGQMKEAFARQNLPWQKLTPQEVADVFVYLRSLRGTKAQAPSFELGSGETGAALFESKGCAGCHKGELSLEGRLRSRTLGEIATAMWNHVPQMSPGAAQRFQPGEMGQLLNFLWARQYFANAGNAANGRKVFSSKGCTACHGDASSGAPDLTTQKGNFSSIYVVSALWRHGPTMHDRMKQKNIQWPRFEARDMADLIAFLNQ